MIESPYDLSDKERQMCSTHATNARKFALEYSPEPFDVVGVNIVTHKLSSVMIDVLMHVSSFRESAVHFEAVSVYVRTEWDEMVDDREYFFDIKFFL